MENNIRTAYNQWADSYDTIDNKTRDLDEIALQTTLSAIDKVTILELGCGTGKNTKWLAQVAKALTAVDFSEEMIKKAREKVTSLHVQFIAADLTKPWPLDSATFDMATCNLVLEHIQNLHFIFSEANRVLKGSGQFFISELHPAKQYRGSKARFEKNNEVVLLDCFVHHASDFFNSALDNGFTCIRFNEWFDDGGTSNIPRLITFLFEKKQRKQ